MEKLQEKENLFIEFYGKHNISPVRQNINDFSKHLMRREKLYKTLGIPSALFKNRKILEVGPGGGYNSTAFFYWGAEVDFVEPNPKGQEEIPETLASLSVDNSKWNLNKCIIEDYVCNYFYDLIIAEGFLPGITNRKEIINKICGFVNEGGVVVVTCVDDISYFFENLKRLLGFKLIENVTDFEEKVKILCQAFESHLNNLKNASRYLRDYVIDQFLNPAFIKGSMFGIDDCINEFGASFEFLSSSPKLVTDYSWYKDFDFDVNKNALEQFYKKRHNLILVGMGETIRREKQNEELFSMACSIKNLTREIESGNCKDWVNKLVVILESICANVSDFDKDWTIRESIKETIELLKDNELTVEKVSQASKISKVFGRGQQYVSMVKRHIYK